MRWARYFSVTEVPYKIESLRVSEEETFCFFETWRPAWGSSPRSPTFQAGSFNHCTRALPLFITKPTHQYSSIGSIFCVGCAVKFCYTFCRLVIVCLPGCLSVYLQKHVIKQTAIKHETFTRWCVNVGPALYTVDRHDPTMGDCLQSIVAMQI